MRLVPLYIFLTDLQNQPTGSVRVLVTELAEKGLVKAVHDLFPQNSVDWSDARVCVSVDELTNTSRSEHIVTFQVPSNDAPSGFISFEQAIPAGEIIGALLD